MENMNIAFFVLCWMRDLFIYYSTQCFIFTICNPDSHNT